MKGNSNNNGNNYDDNDSDLGGDRASQALFSLAENLGKITSFTNTKAGIDNDNHNDIDNGKDEDNNNLKNESIDTKMSKKMERNKKISDSYTVSEMEKLIKEEYEELFFVTGNMKMDLYRDGCVFADPFHPLEVKEAFEDSRRMPMDSGV